MTLTSSMEFGFSMKGTSRPEMDFLSLFHDVLSQVTAK